MGKLKMSISMSLDGFVAGPDQSEENPLGIGGEELHEWVVPLRAFREGHGRQGGEVKRARRSPRGSSAKWARPSWAETCSVAGPDRGVTTPGRAGGETTRPTTARSSFSPTTRASRWSCRAVPPFTSSRMESSRPSSRRGQPPATRTCLSAAERVRRSSTWRRVCWTRSSSRSSPDARRRRAAVRQPRRHQETRASRGNRGARSHAHQIRARVDDPALGLGGVRR